MTDPLDRTAPTQVDLYWRRGCGFCSSLRRALDRMGIERVEHDIWDDADAASTVRRFANGNETVPTVVVGGTGLVNPRVRDVVALLEAEAPHLLPDGYEEPQPGLVDRLIDRVRAG